MVDTPGTAPPALLRRAIHSATAPALTGSSTIAAGPHILTDGSLSALPCPSSRFALSVIEILPRRLARDDGDAACCWRSSRAGRVEAQKTCPLSIACSASTCDATKRPRSSSRRARLEFVRRYDGRDPHRLRLRQRQMVDVLPSRRSRRFQQVDPPHGHATTTTRSPRWPSTPGSDHGYAVATGPSGRFGLYRYDFAADRLGELVYENPIGRHHRFRPDQ